MTHHSKTLVVDFDDTIAITLNRDWDNAKPNSSLIHKLNSLYEDGWTIHIVTARGQISCDGDSDAADKKYRTQIEKWLSDHNVKYTDLSFQKKLAAYYIDDKGITPEDFVEKFEREEFKNGMSGAYVYYDKVSDAVYKTASNTHSVVSWYEKAKEYGFNVPKIYSVIGDTIKMEKLPDRGGDCFFKKALNICKEFSQYPKFHSGTLKHMYVNRCFSRIKDDNLYDEKFLTIVLQYAAEGAAQYQSFSHGDFSHSNILFNKDIVYLIDPINDPTLLSSWIIDLAKLYMSIHLDFGNEDHRLSQIIDFCSENKISMEVILANVVGHYCRVYPYANEDKKTIIKEKLKEICDVFRSKIDSTSAQ